MSDEGGSFVIPEKPNLSLYVRQRVKAIIRAGKPWQWAIMLESGVLIINKDEREEFSPDEQMAGNFTFDSFSMSVHDTTLHFRSLLDDHVVKFGLSPTKYAIHDPVHGGEVYPQWPEELEKEWGIPSVEGGELSAEPSVEWGEHYDKLIEENRERSQQEAAEFLADVEQND